jgi:2-polyprenyl-6-hydroxyphenyl methylase/3-demethylubiquinone-9 3-methyltransferase
MDAISDRKVINNSYYDDLADRWYAADDDPVALLRIETQEKLNWALPLLREKKALRILDIGCGGGFATNALALMGFEMTGLDFSQPTLDIAQKMDKTQKVQFVQGDAYQLPFAAQSFDAVIAFDFLEHVSAPDKIVQEASRVLKPDGQFLYHTFNRNWLSWLIIIKGVEWFVKNTPKDLHTLKLFITPKELEQFCHSTGLEVTHRTGLRPQLNRAFFQMLQTRVVPQGFAFQQTTSQLLSYCGRAVKRTT